MLPVSAEDAKRMAIKEEQHDPEYESCSGQQRPDASSWEEQGRRLQENAGILMKTGLMMDIHLGASMVAGLCPFVELS